VSVAGATTGPWGPTAIPGRGTLLLRWLPRVVLVLILFMAVDQRAVRISEWPMQFHPTLQYENALTTRWVWFHLRSEPLTSTEQRWLDDWHGRLKAVPVLEFLTALTYLVHNHERPWIASVITSCFWLLGGVFLMDLSRRAWGARVGAVATLAFYLLAPFGIIVSRSFQHEAFLALMFLVALWVLVRSAPLTSWRDTLLPGVACGMVALAKPGIVLLPLLAAYVALRIQNIPMRHVVCSPRAWTFATLTVLPTVGFAVVFLSGESHQLLPHLLLQVAFYRWWGWNISRVIGVMPLCLGLAGALLMAVRRRSFLGLGLFIGYVAYALVFTYGNMTHDYYLVPLLVITAFGVGAFVDAVVPAITRVGIPGAMTDAVASGALLATVLVTMGSGRVLPPAEDVEQARTLRTIGATVGAGARVLSLGPAYGYALAYHGWLSTNWWPNAGDKWYEELRDGRVIPDDVRLQHKLAEIRPSHFVITELDELLGQPDLAELLRARYCVQLRRPDAIVYDLRTTCVDGAPGPGRVEDLPRARSDLQAGLTAECGHRGRGDGSPDSRGACA
jgi:hypothetical protein